jgi:hypothetical protein
MAGPNFEGRFAGNFSIAATATLVALPVSGFESLVVTNPSTTDGIWWQEGETAVAIPATGSWGANERYVAPGTVQAFALAPGSSTLSLISTGSTVVVNLALGRGQ